MEKKDGLLLGIDLGTSGTKTVLFTLDGTPLASATREYPLYQPQNGWAEQDPQDWWDAACETTRAVLAESGADPARVLGVGISGQMHGLVLLDETGAPLGRSLLWCDGRTGEECREITQAVGAQRLIDLTANPALTGFTAPKLLWVRKHRPEDYARARHLLLPKDYVRFRLTGEIGGDYSDASGTSLLDITRRRWSDEVLAALDIPRALLPELSDSPAVAGRITEEAAARCGLRAGTPVVAGAGDNAAAAVGTGVVEEGKAFTTLGTSGVVFAHADSVRIDPQGRVHTFCAAVPGAYTVMSCTLAAGLSLKWLRDQFFSPERETAALLGKDPYVLMDQQAARIPIGADRLLFLPYLMGERSPLLDENARGVFFGLSAVHTRAHLLRAVLEGVVYSQRQCLDILREMKVAPETMLACGGGGSSPLWRQMLADVFAMPVQTAASKEGPALGAAILAGVGAGVWPSVPEACRQVIRVNAPELPDEGRAARYEPFYRLYKELYPALKPAFRQLAAL